MQYFFWWILFHNPNTPHILSPTTCIIPNAPMSSQTLNVIPNAALLRTHLLRRMLRDLIIVPQNRSFLASLSGHPPRRRKLLLRWTAPQAFQSLPLVKVLRVYKIQRKTASNIKTESKSFCPKHKTNFLLVF